MIARETGDRIGELVNNAEESGRLTLGESVTPEDLNDFQPHQVRKKHALKWRYQALADMGLPIIATDNLRIDSLGEELLQEFHTSIQSGGKKHNPKTAGWLDGAKGFFEDLKFWSN